MQKPHLQRRADFVGNNPIAEHNDAGILVTRVGNEYRFGVELDVDTVVEVESTKDKHQINPIIEDLLPQLHEIREHYKDCFKD